MSVSKTALSGKRVSWSYEFAVGSRGDRQRYYQGGFATEKAAKEAEAAKRVDLQRATKIAATGSLHSAIARFFEDRGADFSPKTLARYRELVAYLHPDLQALPVGDVTPLMLHDEWKRLLAVGGRVRKTKAPRPLSKKTVRNIASVVSSAFSWACLYGMVTLNPASVSRPPSAQKREGQALSPAQIALLLSSATGWLADFLAVEYGLGIRRGEALALRWSDLRDGINDGGAIREAHITRSLGQVKPTQPLPPDVQPIEGGLFYKTTKGKEPRKVEIFPDTLAVLDRHRAEQDRERAAFPEYDRAGDLIFCDPFGHPLKPDSVSSKVSLLCRRLKLPAGVSLHTLRHTHGSKLIADGADIGAVSARLGHRDAGTTLGIYTHAIPGRADLAKKWQDADKKKPQ